ncbi:AfsR/SARP family transcriptional regulator [Planomonospora sp. ID91781]|uniref:Putative SARP-family transcriptional activator n=1 Tax=Planomonospora sphaerica TaxID=161355 RepID=A0A171C2C5_9ACTN|nr:MULTISPECIES: AfsR/SARP family transcriptional regulator [Planomonospora]MBG0824324.1 AfsR/SARP family transcriptional regulator [Planomonospora sp. ID91781]GAT65992.1 putative SARP-family transcriptional activator [Planomonospora sphaerica]
MFFRLLGRVQVENADTSLVIASAPIRGLLAALLLEEGRFVTVEQLMGSLWESPPDSARKNLRLHVARLRGQLASLGLRERLGTLRGGGGGYRLLAAPEEVDAIRFKRLTDRGFAELRARSVSTAEATLAEALKLWQGSIGQDCTASERLRARFAAFDELHLTTRERLVEARLCRGRTIELVPEILDILTAAPFRENSWAHLMRAYYLGGDAAGAISAWDRATATLGDRLGLDLSAELRELHLSVLRRDDDAVRGPVAPGPGSAHPVTVRPRRAAGRRPAPRSRVALTGPSGCPPV